jgi:hypothetical protein
MKSQNRNFVVLSEGKRSIISVDNVKQLNSRLTRKFGTDWYCLQNGSVKKVDELMEEVHIRICFRLRGGTNIIGKRNRRLNESDGSSEVIIQQFGRKESQYGIQHANRSEVKWVSLKILNSKIAEFGRETLEWTKLVNFATRLAEGYRGKGELHSTDRIISWFDIGARARKTIGEKLLWESVSYLAKMRQLSCILLCGMNDGKGTSEFKNKVWEKYRAILNEILRFLGRKWRVCYVASYEAVGYGNLSGDKMRTLVNDFIVLAELLLIVHKEVEIDEMSIKGKDRQESTSKWTRGQEGKIEEGVSNKIKRRKLKLYKLIDKLTIGDLNRLQRLDVTEFVWDHEKELLKHMGRKYKRFVKWKDKTRLKGLVSGNTLKKIWEYFGNLFTKFKKKKDFIRRTEYQLSNPVLLKESKQSLQLSKVQWPYTSRTIEIWYPRSQGKFLQCSQLDPGLKLLSTGQYPRNVGRKLQWAIIRKLSR